MHTRKRLRSLAWLGVLASTIGVSCAEAPAPVASVAAASASGPGCAAVDASIVESKKFTPYEAMRSHLPDLPINPSAEVAPPVPVEAQVSSIDGLPLRWAIVGKTGSVYQYFLGTGIDSTLTLPDFYAAGGIVLDRDRTENDGEVFAEHLLATAGDRAVKVEIGDHTGALVWADPEVNGIRPHQLYWTDGEWNYILMADRSPEGLLTLGRELVCAGKIGV